MSYELQVSKDSRRFGLGRLLAQTISDIGAEWGMTKVMLTVLKGHPRVYLTYDVAHVFCSKPGSNVILQINWVRWSRLPAIDWTDTGCRFTVDETSPDFSKDSEGGTEDEYDYCILSRCI
jgi:hypothetical protein